MRWMPLMRPSHRSALAVDSQAILERSSERANDATVIVTEHGRGALSGGNAGQSSEISLIRRLQSRSTRENQ
jgi:hypothetical protein